MADYKKMYVILFNAVTDAVEQLESQRFDLALYTLECAQRQTEELFLQNGEPGR